MEGGNRRRWPLWKNLTRRLWKRINIMGCCGSSNWVLDSNAGEEPLMYPGEQSPAAMETVCIAQIPAGDGTTMNLAAALAADRRQMNDETKVKPLKSIVRLFEEIEGGDAKASQVMEDDDGGGGGGGIGTLCCLCTERNRGAALIPCGHTYCRVCSRSLWSKHATCPLCNRLITEILEIF